MDNNSCRPCTCPSRLDIYSFRTSSIHKCLSLSLIPGSGFASPSFVSMTVIKTAQPLSDSANTSSSFLVAGVSSFEVSRHSAIASRAARMVESWVTARVVYRETFWYLSRYSLIRFASLPTQPMRDTTPLIPPMTSIPSLEGFGECDLGRRGVISNRRQRYCPAN